MCLLQVGADDRCDVDYDDGDYEEAVLPEFIELVQPGEEGEEGEEGEAGQRRGSGSEPEPAVAGAVAAEPIRHKRRRAQDQQGGGDPSGGDPSGGSREVAAAALDAAGSVGVGGGACYCCAHEDPHDLWSLTEDRRGPGKWYCLSCWEQWEDGAGEEGVEQLQPGII